MSLRDYVTTPLNMVCLYLRCIIKTQYAKNKKAVI